MLAPLRANDPSMVTWSPSFSDVLDQPAVIRRRNRDATVEAMRQSGMDRLDIPAFLRKQAD